MNLNWEMEIDTPATIGIIGGGMAAIESALYARFLGYDVQVFSENRIGSGLARWGDTLMPVAFGQAASPLGLAALEAQGTPCDIVSDTVVSFSQYVKEYLVPVAKTDLIYDNVSIGAPVKSISRIGADTVIEEPLEDRAEREFRLLIDSKQRGEHSQLVDIVFDCSGLSTRCGMASGGGRAAGELENSQLLHGKRDILSKDKLRFSGKHTVLWGDTLEACATVADFYALAEQNPATKLTWVFPRSVSKLGLRNVLGNVPECFEAVVSRAAEAIEVGELPIVSMPGGVEACRFVSEEDTPNVGTWEVRLQMGADETLDIACDQLIHCGRRKGDWSFADAISPMPIPVADQPIVTAEPHYYVLGNKLAESTSFSAPEIREQIRQVFALVGGRADLNLYETVRPQS